MPVKFYLHPKVNKKGEAPITISINIRQTRLLTTLGYSVDPAAWEESGQVKVRYTNSKGIPSRKINNRIMKIKLHFSEYENDLKVRPTLDEIKEQLATAISLGDDLTPTEIAEEASVKLIYEFFDQFVKEEFEQFFFGEEDYRFVKDFELRTVFVDCFLLTVPLADSPVQEPLEIIVMFLNSLFFHIAYFSQMHDETAESFFVEITELESLAERFQMNLEVMPVLEGGSSPLIKHALFFYELIKEFIDEFY